MSIHCLITVPKEIRLQLDAEVAVSEAEQANHLETSLMREELSVPDDTNNEK